MHQAKRLGIFARSPVPGAVKTRLVPSLGPDGAAALYGAFLVDLFRRLHRLKGLRVTVFHAGEPLEPLERLVPGGWALEPQRGGDLGERLAAAGSLLGGAGARSVIVGSDSPDLPIQYVRRAFQRLKHKDVVLGPATDGGYYLVGTRAPAPDLFEGVDWGGPAVFGQTVENVRRAGLSLHVLPLWYDVDTAAGLALLQTLTAARRVEGRDRLRAIEEALARISGGGD